MKEWLHKLLVVLMYSNLTYWALILLLTSTILCSPVAAGKYNKFIKLASDSDLEIGIMIYRDKVSFVTKLINMSMENLAYMTVYFDINQNGKVDKTDKYFQYSTNKGKCTGNMISSKNKQEITTKCKNIDFKIIKHSKNKGFNLLLDKEQINSNGNLYFVVKITKKNGEDKYFPHSGAEYFQVSRKSNYIKNGVSHQKYWLETGSIINFDVVYKTKVIELE